MIKPAETLTELAAGFCWLVLLIAELMLLGGVSR